MDLRRAGVKASRKDPVDHSAICKKGVGCRSGVLTPKGVLKTGARDPLRDVPGRYIHIQVAGKYDRRVHFVALGILKSFVQLRTPEPIVPSAFEVQVVGNDLGPSDIRVGDKCEPATQPFLKRFNFRQKPVRPPKVGLLLKAQDTSVHQWPRREGRLPMEGGTYMRCETARSAAVSYLLLCARKKRRHVLSSGIQLIS